MKTVLVGQINPLCDKLGLSPNQVTLLSMAWGVGAGFLIATENFLWAAVCIQAHHILDGVDGNLARAKGLTSNFGKWLDAKYSGEHQTYTIIFTLLALVVSFYSLIKQIKDVNS
jgi:hypothetical protein